MKIKVIPTGNAPTHYSFNGEVITAHYDGKAEHFGFSGLSAGDQFQGVALDTLEGVAPSQVIRDAYRDEAGELHVTLCQKVGPGHWEAGEEIDSSQYDPDQIQVAYRADKPHAGTPAVWTRAGKMEGK